MIIDTYKIEKMFETLTAKQISELTGISQRTIESYVSGSRNWLGKNTLQLAETVERLENEKMKNNENPLLNEDLTYQPRYENKNVKYARITFANETEPTIFQNANFGSRKKRASWIRDNGEKYAGIIDANPTAQLAQFSNTEISTDGVNWESVKELVEK